MRSARSLVLTLALVALAAAAYPGAAGATWPGKPGRIGFYALAQDRPNSIYSIRPDGRGTRRLLSADGRVTWSPNGKRIAYFRGGAFDELWQARADGTGARRVLDMPDSRRFGSGYGTSVAWSPSGRRLVLTISFEREVDGEDGLDVITTQFVYVVRRDGKGLRRLRRGHDPAWSPRGMIAYATKDGDIATVRPDGRGRRIWVPQGSPAYVRNLDFSPDGRKLVYQRSTLSISKSTIRTFDFRTRRRTRFRDRIGEFNAFDVAWAPNGRRIAYLHSPPGVEGQPAPPQQLRTIRPSGKRRKTLFDFPGEYTVFDFAWQTR